MQPRILLGKLASKADNEAQIARSPRYGHHRYECGCNTPMKHAIPSLRQSVIGLSSGPGNSQTHSDGVHLRHSGTIDSDIIHPIIHPSEIPSHDVSLFPSPSVPAQPHHQDHPNFAQHLELAAFLRNHRHERRQRKRSDGASGRPTGCSDTDSGSESDASGGSNGSGSKRRRRSGCHRRRSGGHGENSEESSGDDSCGSDESKSSDDSGDDASSMAAGAGRR